MSIRTKTLAFIGLTLVMMVAGLYIFAQIILLQNYEDLERVTVETNVQQGINALETKIDFFHHIGMDWAHWDDTYNYVQGLNETFIEDNVLNSVFEYYNLDFILFVNVAGEIIYSQGYDSMRREQIPVDESLSTFVMQNEAITQPRNEQSEWLIDGFAGLVLLPEHNVILATTPILPGDLVGEPQGVLIWGHYLDDAFIEELANETKLKLAITRIEANETTSPADAAITIDWISDESLTGSRVLNDLFGKPALIFTVEMVRSIYQQGQKSITYFLMALILFGAIMAGMMAILLEKGVLSRIAALNRYVSQIQVTKDVSSRLQLAGNDELSNLSSNINSMLDTLQAQEKIKIAHDKAVEAARLKAEILANVSHDARTPLTVIMMRTEMLTREIYGPLTPKQIEVLSGITANSYQLLDFINNMLEGAKLESGSLKLEIGELAPAKLLASVKTTLHLPAAIKNLSLETELEEDVPKLLQGDEKRLDRILANLVGNAIKFTDKGLVRVRIYRFDADHWAMEVKDTGAGISPEHQKQIFMPFWQVDGSATRPTHSGVGLGLSIVHQLAELMGGFVKVESTVKIGSSFTVVLPIQLPVKGN